MTTPNNNLSQQTALLIGAFQKKQSESSARAVTSVIEGTTLTVTLQGTLSPAERALAKTTAGAKQVQEHRRLLFAASAAQLCEEIRQTTGLRAGEATVEVETTSGTMVQTFQLASEMLPETWQAAEPAKAAPKKYAVPYST